MAGLFFHRFDSSQIYENNEHGIIFDRHKEHLTGRHEHMAGGVETEEMQADEKPEDAYGKYVLVSILMVSL